jgi:3-hydroxybutyryl-CoA dehydrogenase
MLINEAADALFWNVATRDDLDLAMVKGVGYPKGLLRWADELGASAVLDTMRELQEVYGEDRYRPSPLLRTQAREGGCFHEA